MMKRLLWTIFHQYNTGYGWVVAHCPEIHIAHRILQTYAVSIGYSGGKWTGWSGLGAAEKGMLQTD